MAKSKGEGSPLYLPGWDSEEHVRIGRNQAGELEIGFTGTCAGCRESYPDMQHTIQIIAQKTSLTIPEATAFYLGSTIEYEIEWGKTTILAVIGSPLEHGILAEGAAVAFNFPPSTTHLLPGAA